MRHFNPSFPHAFSGNPGESQPGPTKTLGVTLLDKFLSLCFDTSEFSSLSISVLASELEKPLGIF
jgi:hypothetical protein